MANCKFKIGDKVIGNHPDRYSFTNKGWKGVVRWVHENGHFDAMGYDNPYNNQLFTNLDSDYFDLIVPKYDKIVITHDGKTTTATKYCEDGSKVTATARCAPEDTFDFNFGANLAMERLMEKVAPPVEWIVVNRKPKVGDYIRLKDCDYHFDHIGDILKVDVVKKNNMVTIYEKNHPNLKEITYPDFEWNYTTREYELVEKVIPTKTTEPEPPKYYNGKVVCVNAGNVPGSLTVGRIYTFVNGLGKTLVGNNITSKPIKDCDDLNYKFNGTGVKFIPLVE